MLVCWLENDKAAAVLLSAMVAAEYKTNHHFVHRGSLTGSENE